MYKLSKPQKLIYDMSKAVDGTISLICGSLITKGSKDLSVIKKAVNEIYRLNDALRIRIIETKQGPRQIVSKFVEREIEALYFNDKEVELQPIPVKASKYDFTFNIMPMKFKVAIMVEYCTELYRKSTIQRFVEGYLLVLNQMLYVSTLLKDISVISDLEKKKIQAIFNNTLVEYPRTKCVHQLFEEQVIRTPDKIAVIACDKTMTYSELNKQSDKIAYSLIAKGIGVGDIVAFALPRKSYLIAVILGILKTGAAYLPIDLDYPKNRIDYILDNSNAKSLVTEENIEDLLNNERMDYPEPAVSSENICYCIYTSGSTGNPKGVLIRHKNLVNFCSVSEKNSFQKEVVSQGKILLSTFKCCFDAFGVDYALFLLNGKTVVLAEDNDISNGEKLAYLARKYNVDVIHSTPSIIKSLCFNNLYLKMLKQIKVLIIAAERFYPELYSYLKGITSAEIFNGYGPTEATIGVTFGKMDSENIHIGGPIANTQIYIVDKYMKLVPIGVMGELCIAGDGVGAGYQNCSDITAEKFVENPFGEGKLYKTGDLAYWR